MPSPNDNMSLKDGNDNPFKMRAKDVSAAQDGSLQRVLHLASPFPVDYGVGGCYKFALRSGQMSAGLGANSPVFSLRNTSSTLLVILRKLRFNMWTNSTPFASGTNMTFETFIARNFTASDSGGSGVNLTGKNGAQRTAMASSALGDLRVASTATLTAGTRTLDQNAFATVVAGAPTAAGVSMNPSGPIILYDRGVDEHPLVLAQNEGIVLQATMPATGVWSFQIDPSWDEVPLNNF